MNFIFDNEWIKHNLNKEFFSNEIKYIFLENINTIKINKKNPIIKYKNYQVNLINNIYELSSNNANYTSFHKSCLNYESNEYKNCKNYYGYIQLFNKFIYSSNIKRNNILVLGFGLGGIPLMLAKDNKVKNIDSIELDYDLYKIFKTIVKNPSPKIKYIHDSAENFLKQNYNIYISTKYNIIFDDIFNDLNKIYIDIDDIYNNLDYGGYYFANIHSYNKITELTKIFEKSNNFIEISYIKKNEYLFIARKKKECTLIN